MLRLRTGALVALLLAPTLFAEQSPAKQETKPFLGVVVEEVMDSSAPYRAGIRPGDILTSWKRSANPPANPSLERGDLAFPMDAEEASVEQAERGPLIVVGIRSGQRISFEIPPGFWDVFDNMVRGNSAELSLRPLLAGKALSSYLQGLNLIQNKEIERGVSLWRSLAETWSRAGMSRQAIWMWLKAGTTLARAKKTDEAVSLLDAGLAEARKRDMPDAIKQVLVAKAVALAGTSRSDSAVGALEEILRICATEPHASLWASRAWLSLGVGAYRAGNLAESSRLLRKSLESAEKAAPDNVSAARALSKLAIASIDLGDGAAAETYARKSLSINKRLLPRSEAFASLMNLGYVLIERGDLAEAEQLYRECLAIARRDNPGTIDEAFSLNNLGYISFLQGNIEAAERYHLLDLAIEEKEARGSQSHATALSDLGDVMASRGDLAAAESYYQRGLAIQEARAPDSLDVAEGLDDLGSLALRRQDTNAAVSYFERALILQKNSAPGGVSEATSLQGLGDAAALRTSFAAARDFYERALAIWSRVSPGSQHCAETLYSLGRVHRKTGHLNEAANYLRRATEALELQTRKLGGTEAVRNTFSANHQDYYRDYIEVLIELNQLTDAFRALEHSRARALLIMLAERDLVFAADVPADLEKERKLADVEYDKALGELRELNPKEDAQEIEGSVSRLSDLRTKQQEIAEQIRKASPRYAALQYSQPLDLAGTRAALDSGTLLLSYSVGREKSFLFVVSADPKRGPPLSIFSLLVGEKTLRESAQALRTMIEWNKAPPDFLPRSQSLYDTLLKPAEALIAKSERLLILPDGPLHTLPWAGLVRDLKGGQPQYLVEWKPIHTAVSATVYAELRKSRHENRQPPKFEVAAFGDPKYPSPARPSLVARRGDGTDETADVPEALDQDPNVRAVMRGGYRFDPLPRSREEVQSIASLYAPKSEVFLGEEATEERAKSLGKDIPLIHFACHAILNERFPLDSALALTIPEHPKGGQDNGLLQAWEIFEKVRIDADLVTLSACNSGLGKEMGGEGLIGLTRAFQYAGARSILASLWKVEDLSTAELMKRFYGYLKSGKTKEEALRQAQIDLIHSPNFSHPSQWAAFQLNGDWR